MVRDEARGAVRRAPAQVPQGAFAELFGQGRAGRQVPGQLDPGVGGVHALAAGPARAGELPAQLGVVDDEPRTEVDRSQHVLSLPGGPSARQGLPVPASVLLPGVPQRGVVSAGRHQLVVRTELGDQGHPTGADTGRQPVRQCLDPLPGVHRLQGAAQLGVVGFPAGQAQVLRECPDEDVLLLGDQRDVPAQVLQRQVGHPDDPREGRRADLDLVQPVDELTYRLHHLQGVQGDGRHDADRGVPDPHQVRTPGHHREQRQQERQVDPGEEHAPQPQGVPLGLGPRRRARVDADLTEAFTAERYTLWLRSVLFPGVDLSFLLPLIPVVAWGAYLVGIGHTSVGVVTTVALYALQVMQPIGELIYWLDEIQVGATSLARIIGVADVPPDRTVGSRVPADEHVVARGVRYAYRPGHDVLHGVDLDLRVGGWMPASIRPRVDLPAPEGPTMARRSPTRRSRSTPCSTSWPGR